MKNGKHENGSECSSSVTPAPAYSDKYNRFVFHSLRSTQYLARVSRPNYQLHEEKNFKNNVAYVCL